MTKRHFIALADMIRNMEPTIDASHPNTARPFVTVAGYNLAFYLWERTRDAMADFCASQNPAFDRARWLAYIAGECGPNGGKR